MALKTIFGTKQVEIKLMYCIDFVTKLRSFKDKYFKLKYALH